MKPVMLFFIFFLPIAFVLALCGCPSKNSVSPSVPGSGGSSGASGATATMTNTTTSTPTITPTPSCSGYVDLSSYVNGADYSGDDTNDKPALYMDGYGPNGDVYTLTLSSTAQLTICFCPTENPPVGDRDMYLAVRTGHCWSVPDVAYNDDYCDLLPQVSFTAIGGTTYYIIAAEDGPSGAPYKIRMRTGSLPIIATVSPTSTPQALVEGAQPNCASAYDLGGGAALGTGDSVATGSISDDNNTDDYYKFIPANPGAVTVILDSYDNGMNEADFDIYGYGGCSGTSDVGSVGSSTAPGATHQQFVIASPTPSQAYYVDVNAYFGAGTYRLVVQTP